MSEIRSHEWQAVAAVVANPALVDDLLSVLDTAELNPLAAAVVTAIARLRADGLPADLTALHGWLAAHPPKGVGMAPSALADMRNNPPLPLLPGTVVYHARLARAVKQRASLGRISDGIRQRAESAEWTPEDAIGWGLRKLEDMRDGAAIVDDDPVNFIDLVGEDDRPYDWIIPDLLEAGDRLILTGFEGLGKSTILRQMAMACAAGLHPFTNEPIPPRRALIVDLENTRRQIARAAGRSHLMLQAAGIDLGDRLKIVSQPAGMNLSRDRDQTLVTRWAVQHQADVVVIGPIYRMHAGDPNSEQDAKHVTVALDRLRARTGCALLVEAHSAKAEGPTGGRDLRPRGSAVWLGWPEFGYGLRPHRENGMKTDRFDMVRWRHDRDARAWPRMLRRAVRPDEWPWVPVTESGARWSPSDVLSRMQGGDN